MSLPDSQKCELSCDDANRDGRISSRAVALKQTRVMRGGYSRGMATCRQNDRS